MGFMDRIKNRGGILRSHEQNSENSQYRDAVNRNQDDINRKTSVYLKAMTDIGKLKEAHDKNNWKQPFFDRYNPKFLYEISNDEEKFQAHLREKAETAMKAKIEIKKHQYKSKFIRPNYQADIDERNNICKNFADTINKIDPHDISELRYHATSIYTTEQIIKSGGIFSSVDRFKDDEFCPNFVQTTNGSNEISVSEIENLQYSIDFWADMGISEEFNECIPGGCVFVLKPTDQEEKNMIKYRQMHNVDFHENPERLYAIISTTECKEMVQSWMAESSLNENIVMTYDEYEKFFQQEIDLMKNQEYMPLKEGISYLHESGTHQVSQNSEEFDLAI